MADPGGGGGGGGGGAQQAQQAPKKKKKKTLFLTHFLSECLKNKAQIARDSNTTTLASRALNPKRSGLFCRSQVGGGGGGGRFRPPLGSRPRSDEKFWNLART